MEILICKAIFSVDKVLANGYVIISKSLYACNTCGNSKAIFWVENDFIVDSVIMSKSESECSFCLNAM